MAEKKIASVPFAPVKINLTDVYILVKGVPTGIQRESAGGTLKRILQELTPSQKSTYVLCGELMITNPNDPKYYQLWRDPTVIFTAMEDDVFPLNQEEFLLMEGIDKPSDRMDVLKRKLEWGVDLKIGSTAYVKLKEAHVECVIRYKGRVGKMPGTQFGVEIISGAFRKGNYGTTNGTFQENKLFQCQDGCGLFVSLEKLSREPTLDTNARKEPLKDFTHSKPQPTYANEGKKFQGGSGTFSRSSLNKIHNLCQVGQRVSFYDKKSNSRSGIVRWCGEKKEKGIPPYSVVGIETDLPVSPYDYESSVSGLQRNFSSVPKNHTLFLPDTLVNVINEAEVLDGTLDTEHSVESLEDALGEALEESLAAKKAEGEKNDLKVQTNGEKEKASPNGDQFPGQHVLEDSLYEDADRHRVVYQSRPRAETIYSLSTDVCAGENGSDKGSICDNQTHNGLLPSELDDQNSAKEEQVDRTELSPSPASIGNLRVGSVVDISSDNKYERRGMIKWIGFPPDSRGRLDGIKREEDGCPDGKGIYISLEPEDTDQYQGLESIGGEALSEKQKSANLQKELDILVKRCKELNNTIQERNEIIQNQKHEKVRIIQENELLLDNTTSQFEESSRKKDAVIEEFKLAAKEDSVDDLLHTQIQPKDWNIPRDEVRNITKKKIGSGAWGKVYSGEFRGESVAIKQAHREILHQSIDLLKREIAIMAHIQHPNLVRFVAAVLDDAVERGVDTPIIISELLDMNLREAYSRVSLGRNHIPIFRDVAYALHYLHQHREPIIHRDVSAPNVLLESLPNGIYRAKVSDFGSANLVEQSKTAGAGAIVYSAPEMFPHDDFSTPPPPQTTKVDVFSYGVLLLEVILKEIPSINKRHSMLQQVKKQWEEMYDLIFLFTKPNPLDRPNMADILHKLYRLPNIIL